MDGSFQGPWQERWSGLANRLETTLENNAYRFVLCCATVVLVVAYAAVASRIAQPPRFIDNRLVQIEESLTPSQPLTAHDVDMLNRSIIRMQKLASVLNVSPQRLNFRPSAEMIRTPFAVEHHLLRLWLDEARAFYSGGMYEMTSESIAHAIIAITFQGDLGRKGFPAGDSGWYAEVRTLRETCADRKSTTQNPYMSSWMSLCSHAASYGGDGPSPLSLSPWLTSQLIAESQRLSSAGRIKYLRALLHASTNPKLLEYERANRWPADARKFGPLLKDIMSELAPQQAGKTDFRATLPWLLVKLEPQNKSLESATDGLHVNLLVVTSCRVPRLADFKGFDSREVVWARVCPKNLSSIVSLVPASTAEQFAEKNPDISFVQLGLPEISYALAQGWIDSKTDITDFVVGTKNLNSRIVAYQVRPQSEEWIPKAQAFRVKAPIEVLKLMRLRSI